MLDNLKNKLNEIFEKYHNKIAWIFSLLIIFIFGDLLFSRIPTADNIWKFLGNTIILSFTIVVLSTVYVWLTTSLILKAFEHNWTKRNFYWIVPIIFLILGLLIHIKYGRLNGEASSWINQNLSFLDFLNKQCQNS